MGNDEQNVTPFLLYAAGLIDLDDYLWARKDYKR